MSHRIQNIARASLAISTSRDSEITEKDFSENSMNAGGGNEPGNLNND